MDLINILLIVTVLINLMLVVTASIGSDKKDNKSFAYNVYLLNILTIVWWISSMFFYRISEQQNIIISTKVLYISATTIASSFYFFSLIFIDKHKINPKKILLCFVLNIILIFLTINGDSIIKDARVNTVSENLITFGNLYFIYFAYILYYFSTSFIVLFNEYINELDGLKKAHLLYIFIGYTSAGILSFLTNLFLPWMGVFYLNWVGQISTLLMVTSITYAIKKYSLFNIKILTAEIFVFTLWFSTIIKLSMFDTSLEATPKNPVTSITFLVLVIIVGIMLLRSVKTVVEQNAENIALVKKLETAKNKLEEVDEIKNRFVSLATHHMASPLTAIKAYSSIIKEEADPSSDTTKTNLNEIEPVLDSLVVIIKDFLDISQIESGELDYKFEKFNIVEAIEEVRFEVLKEHTGIIDTNKIKINIKHPDKHLAKQSAKHSGLDTGTCIYGDKEKIKKAINNILANSIKYSKNSAVNIEVVTQYTNGVDEVLIKISDQGVRLLPELSPKLLQKFSQTNNKFEANLMGRGLGVYVAKKIIEAQCGTLNIGYKEDTGEWTFCIKLSLS